MYIHLCQDGQNVWWFVVTESITLSVCQFIVYQMHQTTYEAEFNAIGTENVFDRSKKLTLNKILLLFGNKWSSDTENNCSIWI